MGDIFCYEAFNRLIAHHTLTQQEEKELFKLLPFKQCQNEQEVELVKFIYETKLNKVVCLIGTNYLFLADS